MIDFLKRTTGFNQLLFLTLIGLISMGILLTVVTVTFYALGANLDALGSAGSLDSADSMQIMMLKVMQISQAIGLFIVPYYFYVSVLKGKSYELLPKGNQLNLGFLFFLGILAGFPLINFMAEWNAGLNFPIETINQWMHETEASAEKLIKVFLKMDHIGDLVFNLFLIALLPAVGEELLFRGTVQPLLLKSFRGKEHVAIWVTAFLFSFIHMQFLGFFPRLVLGAALGYAAHWSGALWAPMLGHFANNALAVFLAYFLGLEALETDAEMMGDGMSWIYALPSALILIGVMLHLKKNRIKVDQSSPIEQKETS